MQASFDHLCRPSIEDHELLFAGVDAVEVAICMNKRHCLLVGQLHTGQLTVAGGVDFHRALLESGIVQDLYAELLREAVSRRDSDFQILVCVCLHQLSQGVGVHNHEVLDRCCGQGLGFRSDDDSRLRKRVGLELLLGQALDRRQLLCGWH